MKPQFKPWSFLPLLLLVLASCAPAAQAVPESTPMHPPTEPAEIQSTPLPPVQPTEEITMHDSQYADVLSVSVSGNPGNYQFSVEISSPDTGCKQFADWWEVISPQGELLYRRILLHSHVNEQPFTRGGGPVAIDADEVVLVRAHMNTGGYGGIILQGSPQTGFETVEVEPGFGSDLERLPPQPEDCAF